MLTECEITRYNSLTYFLVLFAWPRGVAVLTYWPVKPEIAGSNPVGVATKNIYGPMLK